MSKQLGTSLRQASRAKRPDLTERLLLAGRAPVENRLLASLPAKEREHFVAECESVELGFSEVLYQAGQRIDYVYFPINSFVSLIGSIEGEASLEVGMVGNEGMVGVPLVLDVSVSPLLALVQGVGDALRMSATKFRRFLAQSSALQHALKRYVHVLMSQFAQAASCVRQHVLEARLARWMLMSQDRAHSNQFYLTHAFLAQMLGVRRVGVTTAAKSLQTKKLIYYRRGEITILNRRGLEAVSCSCYRADRETYAEVFG
jgi:CRP-like cAMP-binding protein